RVGSQSSTGLSTIRIASRTLQGRFPPASIPPKLRAPHRLTQRMEASQGVSPPRSAPPALTLSRPIAYDRAHELVPGPSPTLRSTTRAGTIPPRPTGPTLPDPPPGPPGSRRPGPRYPRPPPQYRPAGPGNPDSDAGRP